MSFVHIANMFRNTYYGWFIVAAGFMIISLDGILLYSFGIHMPYMKELFDIDHLESSSLFSVRNVVFAFSMIVAGRLIDKFNPKVVIFIGGFTAVAGMFLTAYATSDWQLIFAYAVLPGIGNGFFYIPSIAIISKWFNERRAFAIGIATLGVPVSGMIIPPLTAWLISTMGLERSLMALSTILAFILLNAFLMRKSPTDGTMLGAKKPLPGTLAIQNADWGVRKAVSTSSFWILYTIFFLGMNTFLIILVNLFDYAKESGNTAIVASWAPAAMAFGSIFGRLFFSGVLTKYFDNKRLLFISYFLEALSVLIIIYSQTIWAFYLFGFMFGFFYSGHMPIFPTILGDYFGTRFIGSIFGVSATAFSAASITGPLLAGYLYEVNGSHYQSMVVAAVICFVAAFSTFFITKPQNSHR